MTFYIRPFEGLAQEHFQAPRTPDTVRRSIDGLLCIVAFTEGTEPDGWVDGMTEAQAREVVTGDEAKGTWYEQEQEQSE